MSLWSSLSARCEELLNLDFQLAKSGISLTDVPSSYHSKLDHFLAKITESLDKLGEVVHVLNADTADCVGLLVKQELLDNDVISEEQDLKYFILNSCQRRENVRCSESGEEVFALLFLLLLLWKGSQKIKLPYPRPGLGQPNLTTNNHRDPLPICLKVNFRNLILIKLPKKWFVLRDGIFLSGFNSKHIIFFFFMKASFYTQILYDKVVHFCLKTVFSDLVKSGWRLILFKEFLKLNYWLLYKRFKENNRVNT